MESALRTGYNLLTGEDLTDIDYAFADVRGIQGVKEATVTVNGLDVNVAVVNTLKHARELVERVKSGEANYHFVEVMACPGGCAGGGGQMYGFETDRIKKRIAAIYELDKKRPIRMSYKNARIGELYEEFLEKPGSHRSHELFHTTYEKRSRAD